MRGSNEVLTVYSDGPDTTSPDEQNLPGPTQPLPLEARYSMIIDTINFNWKVDVDAVVSKLRNWLKGKEIIYEGKKLQEIPTSLKTWAAATHNARQKMIKLYCYLEDNEAGILMQLMTEIQIETDLKKKEVSALQSKNISANEYYRLIHLMAETNARTAWSKTTIPYENRLEYENQSDPWEVLADYYNNGCDQNGEVFYWRNLACK
jgi:hypothetical protein